MRKLILIAFVALLASCSKDGVNLVVENQSSDAVSDIVCYTVLEGDTMMSAPTLAVDEQTSSLIEAKEGVTSYNLIFEYTRADGRKENTVGSLTLSKEQTNASINVAITDEGTDVDYSVEQ